MPKQDNYNSVRSLQALAAFIKQLPVIGAEAYCNGGKRGRPIVERHFTAGNQGRYGWPNLSPEYAEYKQGRVKITRVTLKARGRVVPRGGLPMLNGPSTLTHTGGLLRQGVADRKHRVTLHHETANCHFEGLPDYARYLQEGTEKMPKRSPVDPGADDLRDVAAEMKKALDARTALTNGKVAVSRDTIPGQARVVK